MRPVDEMNGAASGHAGHRWFALCGLVAGLAICLPFLPFAFGNDNVLFNAIAADVHYYARMARFFTELGFFSFDGKTVSNGFMPLWQAITAGLDAGHQPGAPPGMLLRDMFLTSLALTACALAGIAWFTAQRVGLGPAFFVLPLLIPGALYGLTAVAAQLGLLSRNQIDFGIWSFANGMESGLGLFFFALWLPVALRVLSPDTATPGLAVWAGLLSFLVFMARLDDVFLGVALFLGILLSDVPNRVVLARKFALVPLVGSAIYVAANLLWADSPLPVGGLGKTTLFSFPNGWAELAELGRNPHLEVRLIPLLVPPLVGALAIGMVLLTRRFRGSLIAVLGAYLLMKAGFLLSSVPLVHQGQWYYAVMIAAMNLISALAVGAWFKRIGTPHVRVALAACSAALFAVAALITTQTLQLLRSNTYPAVVAALCQNDSPVRPALQAVLAAEARSGIIDTGDGAYAYCLDAAALTVTGLGDSLDTLEQMDAVGFAPFAISNGFDLVVASDVAFASYDWRALLQGVPIEDLIQSGPVQIWRIGP